jgi:hypothetical protein
MGGARHANRVLGGANVNCSQTPASATPARGRVLSYVGNRGPRFRYRAHRPQCTSVRRTISLSAIAMTASSLWPSAAPRPGTHGRNPAALFSLPSGTRHTLASWNESWRARGQATDHGSEKWTQRLNFAGMPMNAAEWPSRLPIRRTGRAGTSWQRAGSPAPTSSRSRRKRRKRPRPARPAGASARHGTPPDHSGGHATAAATPRPRPRRGIPIRLATGRSAPRRGGRSR